MTTNLQLDARQRAMLAEMGVRVWLPSEAVQPSQPVRAELALTQMHQPVLRQAQDERASSIAVPVRREPPLRLPVLSSPPAALGATTARYIIDNMPAESAVYDYILLGESCTGDSEKLLANITRVLGERVFVAQMVASTNESESLPEQLANLPAKVLIALGSHAAKALLGETSSATPFGKLRGTAHTADGVKGKVIVTYHPLQMLRPPKPKAQAWQDLKLAMRLASCA